MSIGPATTVFVTGYNTAGYSPNPDTLVVHATVEAARACLASELDDAADYVAESGEDGADELSASIAASAELVKSDRDGDVAWSVVQRGSWSTMEDTGRGIDSSYWINASTLGEAFGDDTDSDEYHDVVEALTERGN